MHFHETLVVFYVSFLFLFRSFLFLFLTREFPKTETWICVRLVVESGRFGAVIGRAVPCTNEGKCVLFSQDTRRGLTSTISSHLREFRTFSVHLLKLAKSGHHRLLLTRPEHVLVEKKSGARASFILLLLLFGKLCIVTRMLGLSGLCFAIRNATVICDWWWSAG